MTSVAVPLGRHFPQRRKDPLRVAMLESVEVVRKRSILICGQFHALKLLLIRCRQYVADALGIEPVEVSLYQNELLMRQRLASIIRQPTAYVVPTNRS